MIAWFTFLVSALFISLAAPTVSSLNINSMFSNLMRGTKSSMTGDNSNIPSCLQTNGLPEWEDISAASLQTATGSSMFEQEKLRELGGGLPHTDAKIRLFGSTATPRVTYYRDSAAWCPYCQKVWILLEEKKIPYRVEKINMRSYGDKPAEFLRKVPNGLLPAIELDGSLQTDSLAIMLNLEKTFSGPSHQKMFPTEGDGDYNRASQLMRLERELFGAWCGLVFRPSMGGGSRKYFENCLDAVDNELTALPDSPWFLSYLSIVDLTYISHVERMCASVAYWSGFKVRGDGRWPALERWMDAFEQLPSYMATKSDYYTHIKDIPPQYGPGVHVTGWQRLGAVIDGSSSASSTATAVNWMLPLPPLSATDVEPISAAIDPGKEAAKAEAAFKLQKNHNAVIKFALRGAGSPGAKRFQAELADPYAVPNLAYTSDVDICLRWVTSALLSDYRVTPLPSVISDSLAADIRTSSINAVVASLAYLRDRIGVPRDMSYPAARQLRAHLNHIIEHLQSSL